MSPCYLQNALSHESALRSPINPISLLRISVPSPSVEEGIDCAARPQEGGINREPSIPTRPTTVIVLMDLVRTTAVYFAEVA
jgi:hypothetical protein